MRGHRSIQSVAARPVYFQVAVVVASCGVLAFLSYCMWSASRGLDLARDGSNITLFQVGAYSLAAVACGLTASVLKGQRRAAWTCLATGSALAVVQVAILLLGPDPALVPWVTLSAFFLVNALGIAGLILLLPGRLAAQRPAALLVDALVIAASVFAIVWALVGRDVYARASSAWYLRILDLSYPFLSIAVLSLLLFVIARTPREVRSSLRYLAAGWGILAVSMPIYSYLALQGDLRLLYVGPGGAIAFLMLTVVAAARAASETNHILDVEYKPSALIALTPYIPSIFALPVVGWAIVAGNGSDVALMVAAAVVVALLFLRLGLAVLHGREARRALEDSTKFKTEMLRFISHELGNPLVPLSAEAHLLKEGGLAPGDPGGRRNVQTFLRSVQRLESLSRDVRELARLDSGQLRVQPREQDLRVLVRGSVGAYMSIAQSKGVALQETSPETEVMTWVDADRFGQVIDNLLSNALKFTPRGGQVEVRVENGTNEGLLSVQDTGAGLSAAQQKELFTAFGRLHGNLAPGLGLGLVICKAIISQHGGRIWADSEGTGKGTRFVVALPNQSPSPLGSPAPLSHPARAGASSPI